MKPPAFSNRSHAGRLLAEALMQYAYRPDVMVLALPRGGAPVAVEIARKLQAPLDVLIVRKLGVPGYAELAMGAIASGGVQVIDQDMMRTLGIPRAALEAEAAVQWQELHRREGAYRGHSAPLSVIGKTVLLVDDGIATGSTLRAAVRALCTQHPRQIIIAVPIASREACASLRPLVDDLLALETPADFRGVSQGYADFAQTTDDEVIQALAMAAHLAPSSSHTSCASPASA